MSSRSSSGISLRACLLAAALAVLSANASAADKLSRALPPQPLADALDSFAKLSGLQVIYRAELAAGLKSKGAQAGLPAKEALRELLRDTGLTYTFVNDRMVTIRSQTQADGAAASTVRLAQTVTEAAAAQTGADTGTAVVLSGKVTDNHSGANLKGALVVLEETAQSASTDDLGNFRFAGVPPGTYTLHISYLGFADVSSRIEIAGDEDVRKDFALAGGSELNAIVVYGSRSARAQALNQERTAENVSTVISSDMLGNFTGVTLSETLRRAPGVIFERDPSTGDGTNIVIRGLAPDMNTVKFNGIELPEGTGRGRSASLSNVLTESISKVTISKTLLPNQDSSGTGGLVEIETKTPLDRPHRFASFTAERAERGSEFNTESIAAGTLSGTFGAENQFGLSASAQYRERSIKQVYYNTNLLFGSYMPLQVDGSTDIWNIEYIDPRTPFPVAGGGEGVYPSSVYISRSETDTTNLALNVSGAWAIADHSKLSFDYQKLNQTDDTFGASWDFETGLAYYPMPVAALGGEQRRALAWQDSIGNERLYGLGPNYSLTPDAKTLTDVYSFRGTTELGKWHVGYLAGYTKGTTRRTTHILNSIGGGQMELTDLLPEATDPVEGRVLSPFARRAPGDNSFPLPLLTAAGFAKLNDPSLYAFNAVEVPHSTGRNERRTGDLSARYQFDRTHVKYLEAGMSYESSQFTDFTPPTPFYKDVGNKMLSDFGIGLTGSSLGDVGINTGINLVSRADLERFLLKDLPAMATVYDPNDPSTYSPPVMVYENTQPYDSRLVDKRTGEKETAGYLQARVDFGRLEIVGGARMTNVAIDTLNLSGPHVYDASWQEDQAFFVANSVLLPEHATQTDVLPRVLATWHWNDNLLLRAGYFLSVARPQIGLMSKTPSVMLYQAPIFGPNSNQPALSISKGNPDLKPANTHNFDFSAEHYDDRIGVVKLGAFYKRIDGLLESNVNNGKAAVAEAAAVIPNDPRFQDVIDNPQNYYVDITVPANNKDPAHIWGIESTLEKQFTFLPGVWRGLGVYTNYTYSDSKKNQPGAWNINPVLDSNGTITGYTRVTFVTPDVPFNGQAKHSGTLGVTYNQYGIDASLAYTAQARRQTSFAANNLSYFEEDYRTLDLRAEYRFERSLGQFRLYFEGTDLLRSPEDANLEATRGADDGVTPKYYNSARFFGGRQFRIGLAGNF